MDINDPVGPYSHKEMKELAKRDPRRRWAWMLPFSAGRMSVSPDTEDEAKFRALRRLAIAGQDHERELEFHAQEIRSRRFWRDKAEIGKVFEILEEYSRGLEEYSRGKREWREVSEGEYKNFVAGEERDDEDELIIRRIDKRQRNSGAGRFWFGWLYGGFSNFGRSMARPAFIWFVLLVLFTIVYAKVLPEKRAEGQSGRTNFAACADGNTRTNRMNQAFSLSLKNAFVFIDWDRSEAARRTYGCLYGVDKKEHVIVPTWVSFFSLLQNLMSAILIFLFALALRNLLKLK